jgi:hypothetical protein
VRYDRRDVQRMNDRAAPEGGQAGTEIDEAPPGRIRLPGLYPILLGTYPVLFLWSQNLGEASVGEALPPLLAMAAGAGLATVLLGLLVRDIRRSALVVAPLALGLGLYGHLVNLLDGPPRTDTEDIDAPVTAVVTAASELTQNQVIVAVAIVVVVILCAVLAIRLRPRRLQAVDGALLRISAILVAITLVPIGSHLTSTALAPSNVVIDPTLPTSTPAPTRDVFWLIFDRYGSDRSMALRYDIDNELTPWLLDNGFVVLPDSHANYQRTALSIATTANMTPLEDLAGYAGPESASLAPIYAALQGSLVARQFQALGYRYLHVGSWWTPTTRDAGADVNYNYADVSDFNATLVDSSAIPVLADLAGLESAVPARSKRHYDHGRYQLDVLDDLADEAGPKFVLAHVLLPHPPLVFNRDGSFSPVDNGRQGVLDQFGYTNDRLKGILGRLLALPADRQPIIILQADEGPYPRPYNADLCCYDWSTATADELEIKYGIINAWFVPDGDGLDLYASMSAINTFPTLFSGYFGLDYARLPDRSFTSRDDEHPFELTDITDRLPSLSGSP